MRWWHILSMRLRSLLSRGRSERELDEEVRYHFDREVERAIAGGLSEEEARFAARRAMGATEQRKEECRDSRGTRWLLDLLQDAGYAARQLSKSPGFTLSAVLVLALAIGANTAVFTIVNAVLLRPLPFDRPDRLFLLSNAPRGPFSNLGPVMIDRDYLDFRRDNQSFESIASLGSARGGRMTLTNHGDPVVLGAAMVGPDFLRVLHVQPALGHDLATAAQTGVPSVLLSHTLWSSRFQSDRRAIGSLILLNSIPYTVVGVMPSSFAFQNASVFVLDTNRLDAHNVSFLPVIGRLKNGVSEQQALAELRTFASHRQYDAELHFQGSEPLILPLRDLFVGGIRKLLFIFAGAVSFVLLIACANFANLLLIRGTGRYSEIAVRAALGASRGRLVRQFTTESTVLALLGSLLGVALAVAGTRFFLAALPVQNLPPGFSLSIDTRVLLFAIGLALFTGTGFGLVPALQATRLDLRGTMAEGGRSLAPRRERLRGALVAVELALALVLLTGAGLLLKSFLQMEATDPGFHSRNLVIATVDFPSGRYRTAAQIQSFTRQVLAELAGRPGTGAPGAVSFLPFGSGVMGDFKVDDGRHIVEGFAVDKPSVSSAYFQTMGIPLLSGRAFNEHDDLASPGVVIVSQSVAQRLWPHSNALGHRISMVDQPGPRDWLTIIGIVRNVRQQGVREKDPPVIYRPYRQLTQPGFLSNMCFIVPGENERFAASALRDVIRRFDRDLPVSLATMDSIVSGSMSDLRSQARLLTIFSLIALLLAAFGTYGVLARTVVERTHEIGIRMAVGATPGDVVWMILRRTLTLILLGSLAGLAGALALTRVLARLLFEVTPTDPSTFAGVTLLLAAVALLAAWIPAYRVSQVPATRSLIS